MPEILKTLKEKDRGIFIIYKYSNTDVWENDKKNLYMDELAEYNFFFIAHYVQAKKHNKRDFLPDVKSVLTRFLVFGVKM